jgi:ATP-dependent DNA helicase RecG
VSSLDSDIQFVKDIGPKRVRIFKRLGIHTIRDILFYLPVRYEDRRALRSVDTVEVLAFLWQRLMTEQVF